MLPYEQTKGGEAVELYNKSGRTAQEWQELMMYDIMAVDDERLWRHMKFGWSIPRRNGKSELLIMRSIWGLLNGERILYTAHRTTTSHSAWEKTTDLIAKMGFLEKEDFKTAKQFGLECIKWLKGDGIINFRTRSSKGGLGEGYDLLIIDEAQEYTTDQETALKYVVTDSQNPQTLMCGTPPTMVSAGTVFTKYRQKTISGSGGDDGWAEWSVPQLTNAHNTDLWYETNPSLGTILTERKIRSELGDEKNDQVDDNIQRLGLWLTYNQKSAISRGEWQALTVSGRPQISKELFFGVKYAKVTDNVSLAVAVKTSDGKVFVEAIDCRPVREGNDWIIAYLRNPHMRETVIDGAGGQTLLAADMKNADIHRKPILPKVSDIISASAIFERGVFSQNICHAGQPSLEQIVANCEHRAISSGGGFGYSSIMEGADVSLLEAVTLAYWACANAKDEKTIQKVSW